MVSETSCNTSLYALKSVSFFLNQEAGSSGGITPVDSSENASHQHHFLWRLHGLTIPPRTPNQQSPMVHFGTLLAPLPRNYQQVSPGSAVCFYVSNTSTPETFFVWSTHPSTFSVAFARIVSGFGEDFLAVSDFQTVQFAIFTFHEFVTTDITVAGLVVQISHHHRSRTTGAMVDDCDDVCPHLRVVWKQVLLCCELSLSASQDLCDT